MAAKYLAAAGNEVVSTWHDQVLEAPPGECWRLSESQKQEIANREIEEIQECDVLIVLSGNTGQGHAFEAGYALGLGKQVRCVPIVRHSTSETLFFFNSHGNFRRLEEE